MPRCFTRSPRYIANTLYHEEEFERLRFHSEEIRYKFASVAVSFSQQLLYANGAHSVIFPADAEDTCLAESPEEEELSLTEMEEKRNFRVLFAVRFVEALESIASIFIWANTAYPEAWNREPTTCLTPSEFSKSPESSFKFYSDIPSLNCAKILQKVYSNLSMAYLSLGNPRDSYAASCQATKLDPFCCTSLHVRAISRLCLVLFIFERLVYNSNKPRSECASDDANCDFWKEKDQKCSPYSRLAIWRFLQSHNVSNLEFCQWGSFPASLDIPSVPKDDFFYLMGPTRIVTRHSNDPMIGMIAHSLHAEKLRKEKLYKSIEAAKFAKPTNPSAETSQSSPLGPPKIPWILGNIPVDPEQHSYLERMLLDPMRQAIIEENEFARNAIVSEKTNPPDNDWALGQILEILDDSAKDFELSYTLKNFAVQEGTRTQTDFIYDKIDEHVEFYREITKAVQEFKSLSNTQLQQLRNSNFANYLGPSNLLSKDSQYFLALVRNFIGTFFSQITNYPDVDSIASVMLEKKSKQEVPKLITDLFIREFCPEFFASMESGRSLRQNGQSHRQRIKLAYQRVRAWGDIGNPKESNFALKYYGSDDEKEIVEYQNRKLKEPKTAAIFKSIRNAPCGTMNWISTASTNLVSAFFMKPTIPGN
eukprot:GHVP01034823.1.p1 GENE.GHVP01034823.1~~GHVP01034823.1.p1  ORF type:complete len:649 (+),score=112.35 GHVP01034823.1:23-1969(+)